MEKLRRIALLMGKNIGYNRDVIQGIYAFSQKRKNWIFRDSAPRPDSIEWLQRWRPDGIIGHLYNDEFAQTLANLNIPIVSTTDSLVHLNYPLADVHHEKVGEMAAKYLKDLGLEHFAYVGDAQIQYSRQRFSSFKRTLGREVELCDVPYLPRIQDSRILYSATNKMRKWLKKLPKPIGIFCSNDVPARDLADVCLELNIKVPDEVVILGVDNDLVECRLSRPPLSSIEIPAAKIGYEAASMLEDLMTGIPLQSTTFTPPPIRVIERESTNISAVDDQEVKNALNYIKEHFAEIQSIDQVVEQTSLGRRSLEKRFRTLLNKSMLEVLHNQRLANAKKLLINSQEDLSSIAELCGYSSSARLAQNFKKHYLCSPSEYARQYKV
ncbi:substrate-binding domain-containing protein [Rubritalea squalenifaciens]